jgi:hypothetical protein
MLLRFAVTIAALLAGIVVSLGEHAPTAQQTAQAELLVIHAQDRRAHMTRDVNLLLEHTGDSLLDVRNGQVQVLSCEALRRRFTEYFRRAEFSAWDDIEPPVVGTSLDGSMGWMVVRVHIVYSERGPNGDSSRHDEKMAWMSTYEKRSGRWIMTAVTSTSQP